MFSGYSVDIGQNYLSTSLCLMICVYFRKFAFSKFIKLKIFKIMSMRSGILS